MKISKKKLKRQGHDSTFVKHVPCPKCHSRDNAAVFTDGHTHCFGCGFTDQGDNKIDKHPNKSPPPKDWTPLKGKVQAIAKRKLTHQTCEKFGIEIGKDRGQSVLILPYRTATGLVGQKIRYPKKKFLSRGNMTSPPLFGQHLWKAGGKRIVVTEGELDAASISQIQEHKWPVVSIPHGAKGAAESFKDNIEFLNSFESVIICFDMDDVGQEAAKACAEIIRPGKAAIASLPLKDANEMLMKGRDEELANCLWNASPVRPDGILSAKDVQLTESNAGSVYTYPWDGLTSKLLGRRSGELVVHTSGSGMGKTTVIKHLIYHDMEQGNNVGILALEENVKDTMYDLMALRLGKPVRKIMVMRKIQDLFRNKRLDPPEFGVVDNLTDDEIEDARQYILSKQNLYLYDHFGSIDSDTLLNKMEYMVTSLGVNMLYLDHISIVISGQESGNERKDIDVLMTNLRTLVERTDCHVDAVSHLTKQQGHSHEEGGKIALSQLRGSGSLYHLADSVLGYERNQQHVDPTVANTIVVRSLKDRFDGTTGIVSALEYDKSKGLLNEVNWFYDTEGNVRFGTQTEPSEPLNPVDFEFEDEK